MKSRVIRASGSARALAMASVFIWLAACRDLPTASPDRAATTPEPARTPAPTIFVGCRDGVLSSGALWQICLPPTWNGSLIVWAHGYVSPYQPLAIPNDAVGGTPVSAIVLGLGYAYATTSYRSNGLAAVDGSYDVEDVLQQFDAEVGEPTHAYLVGASEGSLTSILALERPSTGFDGGLAVCGPIGDFRRQIDYFGGTGQPYRYIQTHTGFAIDIEADMIALVKKKSLEAGLTNVQAIQRDFILKGTGLPESSCGYVMLFNILHAEEPLKILTEAKRILATGGKVGILHWNYDASTPRGPAMDIRPKPGQCLDWLIEAGFMTDRQILDFPPFHYGMTGEKVISKS